MKKINLLLLIGLLCISLSSLAGEYLMNEDVALGLRVVFSEPVTITGFGDVFTTVDPQGEATEFMFSGGELPAWVGHWFNYAPATARVIEYEWLNGSNLIGTEFSSHDAWSQIPYIHRFIEDTGIDCWTNGTMGCENAQYTNMAGWRAKGLKVRFDDNAFVLRVEIFDSSFSSYKYSIDFRIDEEARKTMYVTAEPYNRRADVSVGWPDGGENLGVLRGSSVVVGESYCEITVPYSLVAKYASVEDLKTWRISFEMGYSVGSHREMYWYHQSWTSFYQAQQERELRIALEDIRSLADNEQFEVPEATRGIPFFRAVHLGGYYGDNVRGVEELPEDFFAFLESCNVNWVGWIVDCHIRHTLDATVEPNTIPNTIQTIPDDQLRGLIRAFRERGFHFYLAFYLTDSYTPSPSEGYKVYRWELGNPSRAFATEQIPADAWPWDPAHSDHEAYVETFFQTYGDMLSHYALIAEEEGVELMSLGGEMDHLFKTRSLGASDYDYGDELREMVDRVRAVYSGWLTYDMLIDSAFDPARIDRAYVWGDLGLDFISFSCYPDSNCSSPPSRECLTASYRELFQGLLPWVNLYEFTKPVLFTEWGAVNYPGASQSPTQHEFEKRFEIDKNGDSIDDGDAEQAAIFDAFFEVAAQHRDWFKGAFPWNVWISSDAMYANWMLHSRGFVFREKPAEDFLRKWYNILE